jgi:hypothetical protein
MRVNNSLCGFFTPATGLLAAGFPTLFLADFWAGFLTSFWAGLFFVGFFGGFFFAGLLLADFFWAAFALGADLLAGLALRVRA